MVLGGHAADSKPSVPISQSCLDCLNVATNNYDVDTGASTKCLTSPSNHSRTNDDIGTGVADYAIHVSSVEAFEVPGVSKMDNDEHMCIVVARLCDDATQCLERPIRVSTLTYHVGSVGTTWPALR